MVRHIQKKRIDARIIREMLAECGITAMRDFEKAMVKFYSLERDFCQAARKAWDGQKLTMEQLQDVLHFLRETNPADPLDIFP